MRFGNCLVRYLDACPTAAVELGGIIRLSYEILGDSCLLVCGGTAAGCVVGQFRLRVRAGAVHRNVDVARYVLCPVFPAAGFFCPSSSGCHRSLRRCRGRGGGMGVDVACQQLYPRRFRPGSFPLLFSNPIFLFVLLVAFVLPCELLSRWLRRKLPRSRNITFVSERRKVTLEFAAIVYVESNDTEVLLHTLDGTVYRTRTRISQWEQLLDDRFVRVHRSYIVNAEHVAGVTAQGVVIGGMPIEFSRKYRELAAARLARAVTGRE